MERVSQNLLVLFVQTVTNLCVQFKRNKAKMNHSFGREFAGVIQANSITEQKLRIEINIVAFEKKNYLYN